MSAFVVSNSHISAILGAYAKIKTGSISAEEAQQMGQTLLDENHRSVNARYSENDSGVFKLDMRAFTLHRAPVEALKLVGCLEYQSCECDDWESTEAYKLCHRINSALISKLPGWDEAKWEI